MMLPAVDNISIRPKDQQSLSDMAALGLAVDGSRTVYRCFDPAGGLLYVGCTEWVTRRLNSHKYKEWWPRVDIVTLHRYPSLKAAMDAEHQAILFEVPALNRPRKGKQRKAPA
jgi:predicted GIY-YIG superfamily endonuclease